jgi:glycosidase
MQGKEDTAAIATTQASLLDIEHHMLHFLENHDEHRIASDAFASDAQRGKPAMVVSALIGSSPTMLYFGQEVGEPGAGDAGFGDPGRTTIFDYWGVPAHQRWMNGGRFDGGALPPAERQLRDFYVRLLNFSTSSPALGGHYAEIQTHNRRLADDCRDRLFAFVRWRHQERLLVVSNFDATASCALTLELPDPIITAWQLTDGRYALDEQLYGASGSELVVKDGHGTLDVRLPPLESSVLRVGDKALRR